MIITEEILGVKGLTLSDKSLSFEKCWKLLMKQGEAWRISLQSIIGWEKNYISVLTNVFLQCACLQAARVLIFWALIEQLF